MLVQVRLLKTKLGFFLSLCFWLVLGLFFLKDNYSTIYIYVSHIYLYKSSKVLVKHEFIRYLKLFLNNNNLNSNPYLIRKLIYIIIYLTITVTITVM